jgi:hypothetical protein
MEAGLYLHSDSDKADRLVIASGAFKKLFDKIYGSFLMELQKENLTDFAGVLITSRIFLSSPKYAGFARSTAGSSSTFIVDEFQDTDSLPKVILDLLKTENNHNMYVGDAKQSIYWFRGAEVESSQRPEWRSSQGKEMFSTWEELPFPSRYPGVLQCPFILLSSMAQIILILKPMSVKPLPVVERRARSPRSRYSSIQKMRRRPRQGIFEASLDRSSTF